MKIFSSKLTLFFATLVFIIIVLFLFQSNALINQISPGNISSIENTLSAEPTFAVPALPATTLPEVLAENGSTTSVQATASPTLTFADNEDSGETSKVVIFDSPLESSFPKLDSEGTVRNPRVDDSRRLSIYLERFGNIFQKQARDNLPLPSLLLMVPTEQRAGEDNEFLKVKLLAEFTFELDSISNSLTVHKNAYKAVGKDHQFFNPKTPALSMVMTEGDAATSTASGPTFSQRLDGVAGLPVIVAVTRNDRKNDTDLTPEFLTIEDQFGRLQLAVTHAWNGKNNLEEMENEAQAERDIYIRNIRNSFMNLYLVDFKALEVQNKTSEKEFNPIFSQIVETINDYASYQ